jgi:hypothetical protein
MTQRLIFTFLSSVYAWISKLGIHIIAIIILEIHYATFPMTEIFCPHQGDWVIQHFFRAKETQLTWIIKLVHCCFSTIFELKDMWGFFCNKRFFFTCVFFWICSCAFLVSPTQSITLKSLFVVTFHLKNHLSFNN